MPRVARGETAGGIYHIVNRGNMRMEVFDDANDYEYFLKLLEKGIKKTGAALHAYCLMPNHFHLLVVPQKEGSLSKLMQWLITPHAWHYHKKHKSSY